MEIIVIFKFKFRYNYIFTLINYITKNNVKPSQSTNYELLTVTKL